MRGVEGQPNVNAALTTLLNLGIVSLAGSHFGYHALPGPGHVHDTTSGLGLETPAQWGALARFPHVTADCSR